MEMAEDPQKNTINKSHGNMKPSEISYPTTANTRYSNTPDYDLKSHLLKMIEAFKMKLINLLRKYRKIQSNK